MSDLSTRPPADTDPPGGAGHRAPTPPGFFALAAALLAAALVIVLLLLTLDDDDQIQTVAPTLTTSGITTTTGAATSSTTVQDTSTTSTPSTTDSASTTASLTSASSTTVTTTTTTTTTTTGPTSTSTTVDPEIYRSAVWPNPDSTLRYDNPTAAAGGFVVDFLGFRDPVVGPFQQGDARSGEVEVRPTLDGPVTTVLVRQLGGDDTWWVLGSATDTIVIDEPDALDRIDSPLIVTGTALAFEGVVGVELWADGADSPLIDGSVTGGGVTMEPFEGSFEWDDPGSEAGTLVLMTTSMDDGRPWRAAVVRVVFDRS